VTDRRPNNPEEERHATGAGNAGAPPQPGPADSSSPPAPAHLPKTCASCGAPILWAQQLDKKGVRMWNEERKRWRSMPVDFQPTFNGNVQVFHRDGEGIVCRAFKDAASAPAGAILRTSHFVTCPNAKDHRSKQQHRRRT
jgi:hypothetical protein